MLDTAIAQPLTTKSQAIQLKVALTNKYKLETAEQTVEALITEQFNTAIEEHFYLGLLYQPLSLPIIELYDETSASIVQLVENGATGNLLTTTLEKYTDDVHLYLRITHQPSEQSVCLKLDQGESADNILKQIQSQTAQLVTAATSWCDQHEKRKQIALWLQLAIHEWEVMMSEYDRECLKLAQTVLCREWNAHTLYRLSYGATKSPVDVQDHPLDSEREEVIKTIVTTTDPDTNRISFLRISETGERTIQIILGGLFDYEPIIFDDRPYVNQILPYHAVYSIGHHRICLPPCKVETYQPPNVPQTPPSWQDHLLNHQFNPDVVDCLNAYFAEDAEEIRSIPGLIEIDGDELVALNPGSVFDVSQYFAK